MFGADDLDELLGWGMWEIRLVDSIQAAIAEHEREPCDLMILLGFEPRQVDPLATAFPNLPLSLAAPGGYDTFPPGYPPQVVVAQWATPRPGEFQAAIENALSHEALDGIYRATHGLLYDAPHPDVRLAGAVSEELFSRLAEFPEERFLLDPRVFEETVADLLARMGYDVRLTPRSGDKGRDVLAALRFPVAPILMLVECKRYAAHRPVGAEPVTRVWSRLFDDHANLGMVVTTSRFAPVAHEFALSRGYQLSLKDGDDYIGWIRSLRRS